MPLCISTGKIAMYFPSIKDQTGWSRSNPLHLLTDYDVLQKVTCYFYDLNNKDFVKYAQERGCMNGAGSPCESDPDYKSSEELIISSESQTGQLAETHQIRRFVRCHWLDENEFYSPETKIYTVARDGKRPRLMKLEEKKSLWETIPPARARLQDCWEVYLINFCGANGDV